MPTIMCTTNLWRALGGSGPLPGRLPSDDETTRLGAWSAKSVMYPEGCFVVGLNERTYLAVAFPFCPLPLFVAVFSAAVGVELLHLGVPAPAVEAEMIAMRSDPHFAKNSNRSLLGSLNTLSLDLGWFLEDTGRPDAATMLELQHRLTETPHVNRDPPFADESVARLFGGAMTARGRAG